MNTQSSNEHNHNLVNCFLKKKTAIATKTAHKKVLFSMKILSKLIREKVFLWNLLFENVPQVQQLFGVMTRSDYNQLLKIQKLFGWLWETGLLGSTYFNLNSLRTQFISTILFYIQKFPKKREIIDAKYTNLFRCFVLLN